MKKLILVSALSFLFFACKKDETDPPEAPPPPTPPVSTVNLPEEFAALENIFDGNGIGAAVNLSEDILLFFNMDGDKYAWFENNQVVFTKNISDPEGHFADYALSTVGAAALLNGSTVYLFELNGENYSVFNFDMVEIDNASTNMDAFTFSNSSFSLSQWGPDNTCPFATISAMWNFSQASACFTAFENDDYTWMVNGSGNRVVRYYSPDGGNFSPFIELENWIAVNHCLGPDGLIPFESIGAACRYVKPNMIQELFFNQDGKSFSMYTLGEGVFSEIYHLY